jgi:hypothetical protein
MERVQAGDRLAKFVLQQFELAVDSHKEAIVVTYVALQMLQATFPRPAELDDVVDEAQTLMTTLASTAGNA